LAGPPRARWRVRGRLVAREKRAFIMQPSSYPVGREKKKSLIVIFPLVFFALSPFQCRLASLDLHHVNPR